MATDCVVAGAAPVHKLSSTIVPSERSHELVRVSVAVAEQLEDGTDQAELVQPYEQVEVSENDWLSEPSVPQE
jgi:hypothetical protein